MTTRTDASLNLHSVKHQRASLARMAYLQLKSAIVQGQLKPGQTLVEEQLAATLDISRTPLREALAMLQNDGLIETILYRGTFVSGVSREEYLQSMQVREFLEAAAIELAIDMIPDVEIDRVEQLIQRSHSLLSQDNMKADIECQTEFHGLAPHFSGNIVMEALIDKLEKDSTRLLRSNTNYGADQMLASAEEHLQLLQAYRLRDRDLATALMIEHLRLSADRALAFIPKSNSQPDDD